MRSWKFNREIVRFRLEDIFYFEAYQRKISVYTRFGRYRIITTLDKEEEAFKESGFVRTHQGYLVCIDYVVRMRNNYLLLRNGERIPVSSRRRRRVYERISQLQNASCL